MLALPSSLQSLFCLPALPRSEVATWGINSTDLPETSSSGWIWPRLRVVPMGWSWAMYFAQRAHQHLCLQATGLGMDRVLVEGRPSPDLSDSEVALIPYADNLNVTGISAQRVQEVKDLIVKKLRDTGFRVHEETEAQSTVQSLGFLVDGITGTIQPVPERLDRVVRCFAWLGKAPRISGRAIERLLGHAVHLCMLRRELLSIFRSLYDFIHSSYKVRTKLWPSAAKEARWASHLMKLCTCDLKRPWSSSITSSDASLSGIAVSRRDISTAEQALHGSYKETWRYKYKMHSKPRDHALSKLDPFEDISTVKPVKNEMQDPFALDENFPEVDANILSPEDWHDVFAVRMSFPEPITVLEGRGVVAAFRHKLRSRDEFNRKHLHLNDNLSVVLLCSKGRSSSFAMLRTCRRLAALALATDCLFAVRWIPSELNVSDRASRQWESLRRQEQLADSTHAAGNASGCIPWIKNEELKEEVDRLCYPNRFNRGTQRSSSGRWVGLKQEKKVNKTVEAKKSEDPRGEDCISDDQVGGENRSKEIQNSDAFGEVGSVSPSGDGLSSPHEGTGNFCKEEPSEFEEHPEVRRGLLQVCQQFVRKRIRPAGWHKDLGGNHRQPPRLWPQTDATANSSSLARVGKNRARPPLPWVLVSALAVNMMQRQQHIAAMAILLMFTAYLRPGEAMDLQVRDLIAPMPGQGGFSLHLHPAERREQSKVGLSDESLLLNSPLMPWLGPALQFLPRKTNYLLDLTYDQLVNQWKMALTRLGLAANHAVLYHLRHSGPSHDRFHQLRSALEVKQRGRWQSDHSVRRYEAHARINQEFHLLPKAVQTHCLKMEQVLPRMVRGFISQKQ